MSGAFVDPKRELIPDLGPHRNVELIGIGGGGGLVVRPGAQFLASLHRDVRPVLIDGDEFEMANASRMYFKTYGNKAAVLREELLPFFSDSSLSLAAIEEDVTPDNVERLIHEGDLVLLAVDNHATRKLVSNRCEGLQDRWLISGGNGGGGEVAFGALRRGTSGN